LEDAIDRRVSVEKSMHCNVDRRVVRFS